jgi:hypothetical protein
LKKKGGLAEASGGAMLKSAFMAITLIWASAAIASDDGFPVHLTATTDDSVGNRLAYAIKEAVRASGQLELVPLRDDAFVSMDLVTLDLDKDGARTVYSLVLNTRDLDSEGLFHYQSSMVGSCGSSKVAECAQGVVANVDKVVDNYRAVFQAVLKRLAADADVN